MSDSMNAPSMQRSIVVRFTRGIVALACCFASIGHAQWWNPNSMIAPGKWEALKGSFVYTKYIADQATMVIQQALAANDFAKLDRMHDEFLAMALAGGNGSQMLESFNSGFVWFGGQTPERVDDLFTDWARAAPTSKLRGPAEAAAWEALAWKARGNGYASEVTPEGSKVFRARLERAVQVLDKASPESRQSPVWYRVALGVAGSLGQSPAVLDRIFDEGAGKFAYYYPLYQTRLNYLQPQWGGDFAQVDTFVRASVVRTQSRWGTRIYAMLYGNVAQGYRGEAGFFQATRVTWPLMQHAFEDGITKPDDWEWLNAYAGFACMARDRDTTRQLLAELGAHADLSVWIPTLSSDACQDLVEEGK
jgi:hypothetical protein